MRNLWIWALTGAVLVCSASLCFGAEPIEMPPDMPTMAWGDRTVSLNEYGNVKRVFQHWGFDEIEVMYEQAIDSGVEPNVWKVALVLVPSFDVTWKDDTGQERHTVATLEPDQMDNARASILKVAHWVRAFSGGNLRWDLAEFVFPETVAITMPPEQQGPFFPPPLKDEMVAAFPAWKPDQFDSVICVFPPGDMQLDAFGRAWGQLHGPLKAGNANIAFLKNAIGPDAGMVYVMLHEWLHQAESVMMDNLGYRGLPNLHHAGKNGYGVTELGIPDWTCWYRDFMFQLFRPVMWQKADMNTRSWVRPGPKFEGGFITAWLVRGPFSNMDETGDAQMADHGLDTDYLDGEPGASPAAGLTAAFPVAENKGWYQFDTAAQYDPLPDDAADGSPTDEQRAQRAAANEIVDFTRAFNPNENAVAYAHVYVKASRRQEAVLWIGSDDGVKVYLNGLMVHRNRVDRGVSKDEDRAPVMLMKGWNRLLVKVDQGIGGWGFSARFSTKDGHPIEGLTTAVDLPAGAKTQPGMAVPVVWNGTLFAYDDVKDDPWAKLPRLDESMLRAMTGIETLTLETADAVLRLDTGNAPRVLSPTLGRIDMADAAFNNQLTYANETLAWLRYRTAQTDRRFAGDRRDLLLVRWDVIEPWMTWLRSRTSVPAAQSLAGYVLLDQQLAYVVYIDLGKSAPGRELDLVSVEQSGLEAAVALNRAVSLTDKIVQGTVAVMNTTAEPVTLERITVECDAPGIETIVRSPVENEPIAPGSEFARIIPLLRVDADADPGLRMGKVHFNLATADGPMTLSKWMALDVVQPVSIQFSIDGPSIVRGGATRQARLVLRNNAAHLGKVTWKVGGRGVKATPSPVEFTLRPLPKTTAEDLAITFGRTRQMTDVEVITTVDVAENTVPDSRVGRHVQVGGSRDLWRCRFEKDLHGWHVRTGTYTVEHVRSRVMNGRGYALIKDGGGGKYGSVLVFGPEIGAEGAWTTAYSSDEYPMIECAVALKDTGNVGIIVRADGAWYGIALTGELAEGQGVDTVIGTLNIPTDGKPHTVRFDLDEALDAAAGQGDHAIEEIWIGDRRFSANREPGPDVGTIMIDDFRVR